MSMYVCIYGCIYVLNVNFIVILLKWMKWGGQVEQVGSVGSGGVRRGLPW